MYSPSLKTSKRYSLLKKGKSICSNCNKIKSISKFGKNKTLKLSVSYYCKECGPIIDANTRYSKYNFNMKKYQILLKKQKYKCAICKIHRKKIDKRFSLDHNHKNNKIRGLLCNNCNRGIGLLGDSIKILKSAIQYLGDI